jgi:hypothetical protein
LRFRSFPGGGYFRSLPAGRIGRRGRVEEKKRRRGEEEKRRRGEEEKRRRGDAPEAGSGPNWGRT